MPAPTVRAMAPVDVLAVADASDRAFSDLDRRYSRTVPERSDECVSRAVARIRHLLGTDPGGAWVVTEDGAVVGAALALRRDGFWGLSLLAVDPDHQGTGIGRALLDAALTYGEDCPRACILSSDDPRALRRYAKAGFRLHPAFRAAGTVDHAAIPVVRGVRQGELDDLDVAAAVDRGLRGAPHTEDLRMLVTEQDARLLVADGSGGRGYAVVGDCGLVMLGADDPDVACTLLWEALAHAEGDARVDFLTAAQAWAVPVVLAAGLGLEPHSAACYRGLDDPSPYLPSGAYL